MTADTVLRIIGLVFGLAVLGLMVSVWYWWKDRRRW